LQPVEVFGAQSHARLGGQNRYRLSEVERFLREGATPAPVIELHPKRTRGTAA
jgi:hypothetical protein